MVIHLKPNAKPSYTPANRKCPKNYEPHVDVMKRQLLKSGVISEVDYNQPSPWLAPTFVVVKQGKTVEEHGHKALRVVSDFGGLSKETQRGVGTFLTTEDVIKNIPVSAKYFFCSRYV
jgi:hypothetical protein